MAYTPGYSGLLNAAFPRIGQYEAATGRRVNKQVVQGLLQADLDKAKQFGMEQDFRNRQLLTQQTQFDRTIALQEKARADAAKAATIGGIGQIAQLPLAYGAAKSAGLLPKGFQLTSPSTWGGTAQAAVAPAVATNTTAQGMALSGAAYPGLAGGTASAGMSGPVSEVAATAPSTGLLGTLAPYAGPAAGGLLGGTLLGPALDKILPGGGKPGKAIGGASGGAIAGAVVGGPVGAVIGGIIGGISSLF